MALQEEYAEILKKIDKYQDILEHPASMKRVMKKDLEKIKKNYGFDRKTELTNAKAAVVKALPIEEKEVVFVMDRFGYSKILDKSTYERNEETVLKQFSGIVLVWSRYNTNTNQASNSDVHTQFISKWCVKEMNGAGHTFVDPYRHFDKYFYVYNDKIVGNDVNGHPGTEGGLSYDNRNCVLRAVIGV